MQPLRAFLPLFLLVVAFPSRPFAAEAPSSPDITASTIDAFTSVDIPVCKASIYIGSVTMTTSRFAKKGEFFEASYQATVFPFFFYKEKGTIKIRVGADKLSLLAKGEKIELDGTATTSSGEKRRIEGTAYPTDAHTGKLKIRIFVSRSIKLSFPTSYFLAGSTTTTSPSSR